MATQTLTYAEIVERSKLHKIDRNLAPLNAIPKHSLGDYPKARIFAKLIKEDGKILKKDLPIRKNGTINIAKLKRIQGIK